MANKYVNKAPVLSSKEKAQIVKEAKLRRGYLTHEETETLTQDGEDWSKFADMKVLVRTHSGRLITDLAMLSYLKQAPLSDLGIRDVSFAQDTDEELFMAP